MTRDILDRSDVGSCCKGILRGKDPASLRAVGGEAASPKPPATSVPPPEPIGDPGMAREVATRYWTGRVPTSVERDGTHGEPERSVDSSLRHSLL